MTYVFVRKAMEQKTQPEFSYGGYRERYEQLWNDRRQLLLNHALYTVPVNFRNYVSNILRKEIEKQIADGGEITEDAIREMLTGLYRQLELV